LGLFFWGGGCVRCGRCVCDASARHAYETKRRQTRCERGARRAPACCATDAMGGCVQRGHNHARPPSLSLSLSLESARTRSAARALASTSRSVSGARCCLCLAARGRRGEGGHI
jgi:hypothetical protein